MNIKYNLTIFFTTQNDDRLKLAYEKHTKSDGEQKMSQARILLILFFLVIACSEKVTKVSHNHYDTKDSPFKLEASTTSDFYEKAEYTYNVTQIDNRLRFDRYGSIDHSFNGPRKLSFNCIQGKLKIWGVNGFQDQWTIYNCNNQILNIMVWGPITIQAIQNDQEMEYTIVSEIKLEDTISSTISEFKSSHPDEELYQIQNINLISLHPEYTDANKILLSHPIHTAQARCKVGSNEEVCFLNNPNKDPSPSTIATELNPEAKKKFMLVEVTGAAAASNNHRQPGLYFVSNMEDIENDNPETLDLVGVQSVLHGDCILRDTSNDSNSFLGGGNEWFTKLDDAKCLFHIAADSQFYHFLGFVEDALLTNQSDLTEEEEWFNAEHDSPGKFWQVVSPAVGLYHWVSTGTYVTRSNPLDSRKRYYLQNYCKKSFNIDQMIENYLDLEADKLNDYALFKCNHNGRFFDNIAMQIDSLPKGWQIYQEGVSAGVGLMVMSTGLGVLGPFLGPALAAASVGIGELGSLLADWMVDTAEFLSGSSKISGWVSSGISTTGSLLSLALSGPGIATAFLVKDSYEYSQCVTDECKNKIAVSMAIDAAFLGFTASEFDVGELPKADSDPDPLEAEKNQKVKNKIEAIRDREGMNCDDLELTDGLGLSGFFCRVKHWDVPNSADVEIKFYNVKKTPVLYSGDFLFRADDGKTPRSFFNNGWKPKGTENDISRFQETSIDSAFVATTKDRSIFAQGMIDGKGYYVIDNTARRGIDINLTANGENTRANLKEVSMPGGIRPREIIGYQGPGGFQANPNYQGDLNWQN